MEQLGRIKSGSLSTRNLGPEIQQTVCPGQELSQLVLVLWRSRARPVARCVEQRAPMCVHGTAGYTSPSDRPRALWAMGERHFAEYRAECTGEQAVLHEPTAGGLCNSS